MRSRSLFNLALMFATAIGSINAGQAQAQYADAVLADNPLGYWRFNDASPDTAVNAGTEGNAYDGTYVGGSIVPAASFQLLDGRTVTGLGADNTAYRVGDDIDEYVQVEESLLNDLPEFTMSAWVSSDVREGNRIGLFGQNDAVEFGFINPGQIQLWTPAGQVLNYGVDPDVIADETWFHLAAVANGESIRLFINGQPTVAGPSYGRSTFDFNIGGGGVYDATGNQLTGSVDDVAFFDRALGEAELGAHVQAARTAGGDYAASVLGDGPVGFWGLESAEGDVALNRGTAGAALNGVFNGERSVAPGANESLPGFAAENTAMAIEAPDDGYVSVEGSPLSGLAAFTLSGWVKPGAIFENRVGLFGQNDALEFGFINPTTIQMWSPNGGNVNFELNGEVNEDEWVHIAATGDGEEINIYIDGEFVATGGTPIEAEGVGIESYGASEFFFNIGGGGIYDGEGNQFTGLLDEVAVWDEALTDAQILAHFNSALGAGGTDGDFNGDGTLDAADIDALTVAMMNGDTTFDLTGDGLVDIEDRLRWVTELKNTYMGDSTLDGEFNSGDLVAVFTTGKFETGEASSWAEGDWNGDGQFNSSDFVTAFSGGGYEVGPRGAVASVPEPSGMLLALLGTLGMLTRRRKS